MTTTMWKSEGARSGRVMIEKSMVGMAFGVRGWILLCYRRGEDTQDILNAYLLLLNIERRLKCSSSSILVVLNY